MSEYADKRGKPVDAEAVNPRYAGMTLGQMAQLLMRPKNPAARGAQPETRAQARARYGGREGTCCQDMRETTHKEHGK